MHGSTRAPRGIHQFVPRFEPRDATGNHTLLLQHALQDAGWCSEVFVHTMLAQARGRAYPVEDFDHRASGRDILVYQLATASPLVDFLRCRREPLILNYHNLTPPALYEDWDDGIAQALKQARRQLHVIAPRAALGIADSAFNARDLVGAGCANTVIIPVLFEADRGHQDVDAGTAKPRTTGRGGGARWLFVGRSVPPKSQHRLVMAFWAFRRLYDEAARLHLVGAAGHDRYADAVEGFVDELGLCDAVDFVRDADDATLAGYYRGADVFVSLSAHEGFGIPLVEAMAAGTPVVALGAGAVPETVGRSGIVLPRADPTVVAAAVHRVVTDERLRLHLVDAGHRQAARYSLEESRRLAVAALTEVAESSP